MNIKIKTLIKIYELDILKGIWIIDVIIFYLLFFIHAFSYLIFDNKFIQILAHAISTIFILIVGITFTIFRNNNKKSLCKPLHIFKIKIIDENNKELKCNKIGKIYISCTTIMNVIIIIW